MKFEVGDLVNVKLKNGTSYKMGIVVENRDYGYDQQWTSFVDYYGIARWVYSNVLEKIS